MATTETDRARICSWAAIMHWIVAIFNISDFTRFITDCTSETFGLCALGENARRGKN